MSSGTSPAWFWDSTQQMRETRDKGDTLGNNCSDRIPGAVGPARRVHITFESGVWQYLVMDPLPGAGAQSHSTPELTDEVYRELRRVAAFYLKAERPDHTLQPTALVHEAWIRMGARKDLLSRDRAHFFAFAAEIMRHVLVDHARRYAADKRPNPNNRCELSEIYSFSLDRSAELLAVDEALKRLTALDPRQGQIVEMRFFAGLSEEEIAKVLEISPRTVKRDWKMAKAWLQSELP